MKHAKFSVGSTILFMVLLGLLHIIEPEIEPAWRFISEYALGKNGWLMVAAFFAWASAYIFLFLALQKQLKTIVGKIGLALLLVSAAGLVLAGIFTTDPVTAETPTTSGNLHSLGGTLDMAMPIAALLTGIAIMRNPLWASAKRSVLRATIFAMIGFLVSIISLGYLLSESNGKIGPDVWVGFPTRFEVLTYCVWLITVSRHAIKLVPRNNLKQKNPGTDYRKTMLTINN